MSAIRKLASQTAVYGMSTILGRLLNYLLVPLHTRIFAPGQFGVLTEMYGYVSFFIVILTYGMETAFFRFAREEDQKDTVFSSAFISVTATSVLFMLLMTVFAQPVASLIRYPEHPEYIIWFAVILGLDAIASIPFALLRQQNKPVKFAIIKNANIFTNILANLYFLLLCPYMLRQHQVHLPFYSESIGVGYVFISHLLASIITIPMLLKEIVLIRKGFDPEIWRRMVTYGLPLLIVGLGGMVNETLDRTIMKYLITDTPDAMRQLGIYGANYKLSILITLFIQAFRYGAEPFFFSHAKTTDKRTIYARVMDYFVLVCLGIFLLVTLYIDLFKLLIDPRYYEGLGVVPVLLLANVCLGVYYNLSIWYRLSDNTGKGAGISLMGAAITIVLNLWWVPLIGYAGAAWATLVCYFSMMVVCYLMGRRYYPIGYHLRRNGAWALLALLLFFAGWWARKELGSQYPLVVYGFSTFLLGVFALACWLFVRKDKMLTSPD